MQLSDRLRRRGADEEGFTLIELIITVAIVGIIVVALTGVVIEYTKTSISAEARMTESHDVQFASAYWQRDVASIGVRSGTYDTATHSFPLLQSVAANGDSGVTPGCAMPSGSSLVVTLAWSNYTTASPTDPPVKNTVAYVTQAVGGHLQLFRVRCTGSTQSSVLRVADNIVTGSIQVACPGGCNGSGSSVPDIVTMTFTSSDPNNQDGSTYSATLTGERRET